MFNRTLERRELTFHLEQGRNVLVLAPRRAGKTWTRDRLADDFRALGWNTVLCDVQGMSEEAEFLRHLCLEIEKQDGLMAKAKGRARQALNQFFSRDSGGWQQALTQMHWASFARALVEGLNRRDVRTLILVDELSLFIAARALRDPRAAKDFLYTLRALAHDYRNVRWLFTGSIGLDSVALRHNIGGALVDLHHYALEPLGRDAARAFLEHLAVDGLVMRPFALDDAGFAHLAAELGWLVPYYLDILAHELRAGGPATADGRPLARVEDIEAAFAALLHADRRRHFVTWEEHLEKTFSETEAASLGAILALLARPPRGERFDTLLAVLGRPPRRLDRRALKDLLGILVADGYLETVAEEDETRYRFRSGLLRRYWLTYHVD